jgi:hypothetical protein
MRGDKISIVKQIGTALISDGLKALSLENTADTVYQKSAALKQNKEISEIHTGYMEIINELMQQKQEAVLIAESYKNELDRVQISDEDILHLNETAKALLSTLLPLIPSTDDGPADVKGIEKLLNTFISASTLRTLQLLGFNFKEAIGEPLTKLVSGFIQRREQQVNKNGKKNNR